MDNEKVIRRGEVWYVDYSDSYGHETALGRPAIVISSDMLCATNSTIIVAYLTTSEKRADRPTSIEISSTGRKSWVLIDEIFTVDRRRLRNRLCMMKPDEMEKVERGIMGSMGVNHLLENAEAQEAEHDWDSLEMERDYYKRLYEKALDHFTDQKFEADIKPRKSEPEPEKSVEILDEVPREKPDVNTCSEQDLRAAGMRSDQAAEVIANRPYKNFREILSLPSITKIQYEIFKNKLQVKAVAEEKPVTSKRKPGRPKKLIPINELTADQMMSFGIGEATSKKTIAWIKKHGPITKLEDLAAAPRVGVNVLKKLNGKVSF